MTTLGCGVTLKELRLRAELPQKAVAMALGVTTRAYRMYENGERELPLRKVIPLARALKCTVLAVVFALAENEALGAQEVRSS